AGADESHSHESADGYADRRKVGAQLAPAPPPERANPVLGAGTGGAEDVMEHGHGQLLVFVKEDQRAGARRRTSVAARCGRTVSGTMPTSLAVGKQPLRLGRSPSMARPECGRCASKEKCRQALRQGIVTLGDVAPCCPPAANPMAASRSHCRGSRIQAADEPVSVPCFCDRVFCHFIDGRSVLRRRLAADGTATLPFGPCHARQLDGHLFWSQRRLRLGAGLIKYRFWWWSGKYPFG